MAGMKLAKMESEASPAEHARFWFATVRMEAALLSCALSFGLVTSTTFVETFTSSHLLIVLLMLLLVQVLRRPRLFFSVECGLYGLLTLYLFVTMLWAPVPVLGLGSLFHATDFMIIMVMFGSLILTDEPRSVIGGALAGFAAGAGIYAMATGFPFRVPADFSYNAMALMYLFGLMLALLYGWMSGSRVLVPLLVAVIFMHVVATTSIKTNLGVLLGIVAAAGIFRRQVGSAIRRHIVLLGAGFAVIAYLVLSNETVMGRMELAFDRLKVGLEVLWAREDQSGYSGFDERAYWMREGIAGWTRSPVFGHGVEAFRGDYGITSHSSPIDLLYNSGLIGFMLFYAVLVATAYRCFGWRTEAEPGLRAILLLGLVAHGFTTFSGIVFYTSSFGAFMGIAGALLLRRMGDPATAADPPQEGTKERIDNR